MVILIVIIILGVILFFLQKAGMFNPKPQDPNTPGITPWAEWKARQMQQEQSQSQPAEPNLTGFFAFDGNVRDPETQKGRGEIKIYISSSGVNGNWYGRYSKGPEEQYDITGSGFAGSFYPDKTLVDENGNEDPSKLYFLCMGEFQMQLTGRSIVKILSGEIYVRGWFDKDENMLKGRIFITSNYKDFKEYEFRGRVTQQQSIF